MNVPDRPRSPDGCDDDAIFADIVAHLNDDVPTAGPTPRATDDHPTADHPAADHPATEAEPAAEETGSAGETSGPSGETTGSPDETTRSADGATDTSDDQSPRAWPRGEPVQWPMNPWPKNPWPQARSPELPAPGVPAVPPAGQAWRGHEVADDEDEDHFEPPPVTPLPAGDLAFWGILAGMGGGPLLLLYLVFFDRYAVYWILTAIAMFVGGFVLLVSRMPGHHGEDDDGARL